jgi:hypothetical protein
MFRHLMAAPPVQLLVKKVLAKKALAIVVVISASLTMGLAAAAGSRALGDTGDESSKLVAAVARSAKPASASVEASVGDPSIAEPPPVAPVTVAAAGPAAVVPPPPAKAVVKPLGQVPASSVTQPVLPAPLKPAVQAAVNCQKLDDAKINWLLEQIAKTKAGHPELAAGAARIEQQLRSALGQNMCAAQAQAMIASMCLDAAEVKVLNTMVSKLPWFIRPMIGDPCKADLVAVMNKVGRFIH